MSVGSVRIILSPVARNGFRLWGLYLSTLIFALFVHVPVVMLLVDRLERADLVWLWILGFEGARLLFFVLAAYVLRAPAWMISFRETSLSPRMFLGAALLFFIYGGAPFFVLGAVIVVWAVQEVRAVRLAAAIAPERVIDFWKKSGSLSQKDEDWRYKLDDGLAGLLDCASGQDQVMGLEMKYIALPVAIIAPAAFLVSQQAGDAFELRSFLGGASSLFMGYFMMPMMASARASRSALRVFVKD